MLELLEVEDIRMQLDEFLTGHVIEDIEVRNERSFQAETNLIIGGKVEDLRRFG